MDTNINNILIIKSKQELQMGSFELLKFILGAKGEKNITNKIASQFCCFIPLSLGAKYEF